jgi:hypothetical protein
MSNLDATVLAPVDEIVASMEVAPRNGFHVEPRCHVCRNDQIRTKVNEMLATGASYAAIVRVLGAHNTKCDKRDRVTVDSVRTHCRRHFPVQQTAGAIIYRDIVERRAQENRVDFVNGVATALTPLAFYEVVMNEAFRRLMNSGAEVSVDTGLRAAEKLQSLLDRREQGTDVAHMMVEVGRIIAAVKSTIPQEMWGEIAEKLQQPEQHRAFDVENEAVDGVFDPGEIDDMDEEF